MCEHLRTDFDKIFYCIDCGEKIDQELWMADWSEGYGRLTKSEKELNKIKVQKKCWILKKKFPFLPEIVAITCLKKYYALNLKQKYTGIRFKSWICIMYHIFKKIDLTDSIVDMFGVNYQRIFDVTVEYREFIDFAHQALIKMYQLPPDFKQKIKYCFDKCTLLSLCFRLHEDQMVGFQACSLIEIHETCKVSLKELKSKELFLVPSYEITEARLSNADRNYLP